MERESQSYHYVMLVADGYLDCIRPSDLSDDAANCLYAQALAKLNPFGACSESMRLSAFLTKTSVNLNVLYKVMPLEMPDILNYLSATYITGFFGDRYRVCNRCEQYAFLE